MTETADTDILSTFSFQPTGRDEPVNLRAIDMDGQPWFVAADVCQALDLGHKNITYHVGRLDADDVKRVDRTYLGLTQKGRPMVIVSESGLYDLISRSDKPEAKAFRRWVNREVLPSIRKTGGYLLNGAARETAFADNREAMPLPIDIAEALAKFSAAQEETNRLLAELLASQRGLTPKTEKYLSARELVAMGIGRGLSASEVGYALTVYCRTHQIGIKRAKGAVGANRYPLSAAKDWSKTV